MNTSDTKVDLTADGRRWPPIEPEPDKELDDVSQRRLHLDGITEKIIGCVHKVSRILGAGFLEKVYENALFLELRNSELQVAQQHRIDVWYQKVVVGEFVADLVVEGSVVVEVKAAVKALDEVHAAQCLNYLRATSLKVCLLVNFGTSRAALRRIVHDF